eukprot:TRINITY_DN15991_c2_g1_i1.p1 TRINITY_DN15991_c2_g1~~TRINITY_DN15991_c2_g1_i1.p1  ORF type:complete len:577 (+),score=149.17 TRINITY_DN15991_c2_g1_i1:242-1732(+)
MRAAARRVGCAREGGQRSVRLPAALLVRRGLRRRRRAAAARRGRDAPGRKLLRRCQRLRGLGQGSVGGRVVDRRSLRRRPLPARRRRPAAVAPRREFPKRPPDNALPVQNEVGHWDHVWLSKLDPSRPPPCYERGVAAVFQHWLLYPVNLGHSFHRAMAVFAMLALATGSAQPDIPVMHLFTGDQWHWAPGQRAAGELLRGWWPHITSVLSPGRSYAMLPVPGGDRQRRGALRELPNTGVRCFDTLLVGWPANRFHYGSAEADSTLFRRRLLSVWGIPRVPSATTGGPAALRAVLVDRRANRRILNAEALVAAPVAGAQFRRLFLEDHCLRRQAALAASVDVLAAVTGSALIWQLAMCPGSVTVQFAPRYLGGDIQFNGTDRNAHRSEMAALAQRGGVRHVAWTLGAVPTKKERKRYAKHPELAKEDVYIDSAIWNDAAEAGVAAAAAPAEVQRRRRCRGADEGPPPRPDSVPGMTRWLESPAALRKVVAAAAVTV